MHDPALPERRLVGVDLARILAIALVVLLHACVAYLERPIAGLLWPVQESPGDTWDVDATFWIVRALGVPIVTLIAGLFAARAVDRAGVASFVRERLRRLGLPLLIAMCTVLPVMYLIWAWGWVERGWAAPIHILHVRFGPAVQPNLFGLAHLWYLEYLLLYALAYAAWCVVLPRASLPARVARVLLLPIVRVVVIAAPLAVILHRWPGVLVEFQNGFVPQLSKLLWNAVFFVMGIVLYRLSTSSPGALVPWARWWWLDALAAIAATAAFVPAVHAVLAQSPREVQLWTFATLGALVATCGGLAILGGGLWLGARLSPTSRAARWAAALAGATFWIYILHLAFQGLASVLLYKVDVPVALKLAIVFGAGFAGPLACFALARRWRVLAWLRPVKDRARAPAARERRATVP